MPGNDRQQSPNMLSLDGLEMIAVLVVMGLFIKVLEQFGMFEPVGGEGNEFSLRCVGLITGQFRHSNNQFTDVTGDACVFWYFQLHFPFPLVLSRLQSCLRVWVTSATVGHAIPSLSTSVSLTHTYTHTHTRRVTLAVCEASLWPWGVCFYPLIDNTMDRVGLSAMRQPYCQYTQHMVSV